MDRGGADHGEEIAVVLTTVLGSALCQECIAAKSSGSVARIETILAAIAGTVTLTVATGRCDACLETRRTFRLDPGPTAPRLDERTRRGVTQHAILRFLGEHPGKAFCADCIATRLFGGKNVDVAMRHLEGNDVVRQHGVCSACGKRRLVARLSSG